MEATVAERSGTRDHLSAGRTVRRAAAERRRGAARGTARPAARPAGPAQLRLIAVGGRLLPRGPGEPVRTNPAAEAGAHEPTEPRPVMPATARTTAGMTPAARTPVRLTRRGRLVVTTVALLVIAAVSVPLAGAAQALGHSGGVAPRLGAGITKVEVWPGQNLWSLAEAYDPNADTRQVIQEILQLNSMSTDQVQPGQILWMPRD